MATVRSALVKKLTAILSQSFPSPSTLRLDDNDGIIGVVTSAKFEGMDSFDRYDLIHSILEQGLSQEERRQVQIVVGVTPEEAQFYEAVPKPSARRTVRKQ